ncbi:ABC transporter substrate-binding protein [Pseudodesulfovibrio sp. zrk46]|uniref:ABC transporter substrate-binding protein n=1 Tax=Pseudodesulfovibrio sp. zrk46 TaxID=2725288 RepID=UPI0014493966|nr:ABC transporter substrate-binding protein [Pseudodesulfovibrio sp. zrk46]QJB57186.1 amino acid ABC transporter substrate-binding protein [Pseudodesulfovibrio sp. zrk46]
MIGAIFVMTNTHGKADPNGQVVLNGMQFAINAINAQGGVEGHPLKLMHRNCKADSTIAIQQFKELAELGAVVIINNYSHITLALKKIALETKVPQLAIMATAEDITEDGPYTFRYWTKASDQAKALLPLVKKLKIKRLGLVNIDNTYGNSVSDELMSKMTSTGIEVQKTVYSSVGKDLETNLATLGDIDAISFTCFPSDILPIVKTIKKVYPSIKIIGPVSVASPKFFSEKELDGIYIPAPLIYNVTSRQMKQLRVDFVQQYDSPVDVYSTIGYDSIMLLYDIFKAKGTKPQDIVEFMERGFVYPGLFGDVESQPNSHHFHFPLRPAQMKNGKLEFFRR